MDGSIFTGREPDEDRYDFDQPKFDSYSLRLSYNPTPRLSGQVSGGYLKSPESLEPEEDLVRLTSSVIHVLPLGSTAQVASSLVYGTIYSLEEEEWLNAVTLESEWAESWGSLYGRYEILQKAAHDLNLEAELGHSTSRVQAATLGVAWKPFPLKSAEFLVGTQGTVNIPEEELSPYYGDWPFSFEIFITLRPARMSHGAAGHPPADQGLRQPASGPHSPSGSGGHEGH